MTIQDSVNLDELRRLAEQATPGPWGWGVPDERHTDSPTALTNGPEVIVESGGWGPEDVVVSRADAAYIAAANPTTILRLLDRVAALEAALRYYVERRDYAHDCAHDDPRWRPRCHVAKARHLLSEEVSHE